MKIFEGAYKMVLSIGLILLSGTLFSQPPSVKTFVDKNSILIGEQFTLKIIATYPSADFHLHWLKLPDSVAHFEIVDQTIPDTVSDKGITTVAQTITFTSFDSGFWHTPYLPIHFDPVVDDTTLNIYIDSFPVTVSYSPPDSSNALRDIKPVMEVSVKDYFWYYIAGGAIVVIAIAVLLFRYFKNRRNRPEPEFASTVSPFDEAMQALNKLLDSNLQNAAEIKQYHTSLSLILKKYLSRKQQKNLMNKTTYDVLIHLTENAFAGEQLSKIAVALRTGDAVKFAKYLPETEESSSCWSEVKEAIRLTENTKPLNQIT